MYRLQAHLKWRCHRMRSQSSLNIKKTKKEFHNWILLQNQSIRHNRELASRHQLLRRFLPNTTSSKDNNTISISLAWWILSILPSTTFKSKSMMNTSRWEMSVGPPTVNSVDRKNIPYLTQLYTCQSQSSRNILPNLTWHKHTHPTNRLLIHSNHRLIPNSRCSHSSSILSNSQFSNQWCTLSSNHSRGNNNSLCISNSSFNSHKLAIYQPQLSSLRQVHSMEHYRPHHHTTQLPRHSSQEPMLQHPSLNINHRCSSHMEDNNSNSNNNKSPFMSNTRCLYRVKFTRQSPMAVAIEAPAQHHHQLQ